MTQQKSKLNNLKSEVIQENILKENPEGLPDSDGIVVAKSVPEMRRIQFINGRDPGQELTFHYASATHPLKHYTLFHGQEYDLPVEVIENLESRAEPVYSYRKGPSGHPEHYISSYRYIFSCRNPRRIA